MGHQTVKHLLTRTYLLIKRARRTLQTSSQIAGGQSLSALIVKDAQSLIEDLLAADQGLRHGHIVPLAIGLVHRTEQSGDRRRTRVGADKQSDYLNVALDRSL